MTREAPAPARAATPLLAWYASRDRDVPWREARDPYRIWVCEVMAQQTRMQTVRERLPAFFSAYPDIESLAASDIDGLMRAWQGLGYYARARNLRRAARRLVEAAAPGAPARVPETVDGLLDLPGVGPYTAGAVASIAFGVATPAVDGNARRVLARLFDVERPTPRVLEEHALSLIREADARRDPERDGSLAGRVNQAIMDLGGEVCTPRSPACRSCPVASYCRALARGTVGERPAKRPRPELPHRDIAVAVVRDAERRILVQRRPPSGLLGGLWEFPGGKVEAGETPRDAAAREVREETGLEVRVGEPVAVVDHAYSHFRITLHAFEAEIESGQLRDSVDSPRAWVSPEALGDYAFPAANRRVLDMLDG